MADITISRAVAEQLYDLYNNVSAADAHYQRCQSDNFRVHVKGVYQNKGIENAFAELRQKIDEASNASESAAKGRKSVLTDD